MFMISTMYNRLPNALSKRLVLGYGSRVPHLVSDEVITFRWNLPVSAFFDSGWFERCLQSSKTATE